MIYLAIWLLIGLITVIIIQTISYYEGCDLEIGDLPFIFFYFLLGPISFGLCACVIILENSDNIKNIVLIRGKRNKEKKEEKVVDEFEEDEGDY